MKNEFIKGQEYKLTYTRTVTSRRWKGTNIPSDYKKTTYTGLYEYIGNRGGKLHFYDNHNGIDVLFTKSEAIEALNK